MKPRNRQIILKPKFPFNTAGIEVSFQSGFLAGAAIALISLALEWAHLNSLSVTLILGSIVTRSTGILTAAIGAGAVALAGGFASFAYPGRITPGKQLQWKRVFARALILWLITGLFLGSMTAIHPIVPETIPAPGFFAWAMGISSFASILFLHFAYSCLLEGFLVVRANKHEDAMRS